MVDLLSVYANAHIGKVVSPDRIREVAVVALTLLKREKAS